MDNRIRRVVTTHDAQGKAVVLFDGAAPNVKVRKVGGFVSTLLWTLDTAPARYASSEDFGAAAIGTAPLPRGAAFRVVDFPPLAAEPSAAEQRRLLDEMAVARHDANAEAPRHAFTHRTKSVDFAVVVAGEIDMLLDDTEVHLRAGDVVVQQATNHAWVNRGTETCRIAFVLIDAEEPAAWRQHRH
ncbi:MAG: cupin domain-containing protein [Alphaproteobacteria bacterium]|nr:cupin domain-containing protein [Alphaproteobacteria bacterium]